MGWGSILGGAAGYFFGGPAGASVGASIGGSFDSDERQREAMQYNSGASAAQMQFQERMANSSYQRGMADMEKAGLNPMLAYSQGGASVPAGAMASYPVGAGAAESASTASLVSSAAQAYQTSKQSDQIDANVAKISQEITNLQTDNERAKHLVDVARQTYQNMVSEGYNITEVGNNLRATFTKLKAETNLLNTQEFRTDINRQLDQIELEAAKTFEGSGAAARQIKPILDLIRALFPRSRN